MIIKLTNYNNKHRVVSLAKDIKTLQDLSDQGLPSMYLDNNMAIFSTDGYSVILNELEKGLLYDSCNYDVFDITENGNAYKYYDNKSVDNAILITNQCNSNCIMCPTPEIIRQSKDSYTGEELVNIARHIQTDAPHITITGGEPFMIKKDLFILFEYLRNNRYEIDYLLLTNGRAFCSKEYSELFKKTRPPKLCVGIPIHGYNSETHDRIVQSPGAFRQTFVGLKNILATGAIVDIRIVVSKLNHLYITNIAELIVTEFHTVKSVKIMGLEMTGNAAKNADQVWIDYATAFKSSQEAIDILISNGINVSLYNFPLCSVNYNYWNICEKSISSHKVRFAPQCDNCIVRDACGGVFSGTIRLVKNKLIPVTKHD